MRARIQIVALATALAALSGCQSPNVGNPCTLTWGTNESTPAPNPVQLYKSGQIVDYFETGNLACEDLVCIVSAVPASSQYSSGGYCSKPCVSDQDCYKSDTGLVCRQVILDPAFVSQLDPAVQQRYLADVQFSSYCAVPR
jgi:hypothetical protein